MSLLITVSPLYAGYNVDVGITVGGEENADTIWVGSKCTFDFYFENEDTLGGYSTGYTVWSDDGAEWEWYEVAYFSFGFEWPQFPLCSSYSVIYTVEGSRQHPYWDFLDNGGLSVTLADVDGAPRDSILFGGTRKDHGVYPGLLEKQIQAHFAATGPDDGSVAYICIDSAKIRAAGDFVFADVWGGIFPPTVLWPEGGRCWPVKKRGIAGDANDDDAVNIADAVYTLNHIFHGGPEPPIMINGDVNSDCRVNIGDAVYMINLIFGGGNPPQAGCLDLTLPHQGGCPGK